jgi:hypothetical protein
MDAKELFDKALAVADSVNDFLPMSGLSQGAIDLARKTEDLIGSFGDKIPIEKQAEAQAVRAALAEKVKAHAKSTSDSLRG